MNLNEFEKYLKGEGKRPGTIRGYRYKVKPYLKWLKNKKPTVDNAEEFVRWYVGNNGKLSKSAINHYKNALRNYLKAHRIEIPRGRLQIKRCNSVREDKFISLSEVNDLVRMADNLTEKVIFRLLFHSGVRAKELLNIKVGDLDLDTHRLNVRGLKKSHKIRSVRLIRPELCVPTITAYLAQRGVSPDNPKDRDKQLLVGTLYGEPLSYEILRRIVHRYGKRIGKPDLTAHWFRHGFVVWNKEHGIPAEVTAMQIGDTIKTTMEIYSHFSQADVDRVMDELEGKAPRAEREKDPIDEIEELKESNKDMRHRLEEMEKQILDSKLLGKLEVYEQRLAELEKGVSTKG